MINRVRRAEASKAATGLILKVNQVGTLTEAAEAYQAARAAGWQVTVSARSGETGVTGHRRLATILADKHNLQVMLAYVKREGSLTTEFRERQREAAKH